MNLKAYQYLVAAIANKLNEAEQKHPVWPKDLVRQAAIVGEEVGELLKAALDRTEYQEKHLFNLCGCQAEKVAKMEDEINEEALQTAAMAVRFLLNRLSPDGDESEQESLN